MGGAGGEPHVARRRQSLQETASCARGINDDESDTLPPAQQATIDALHGVFKIAGAEDVLLAKVVGFALDKAERPAPRSSASSAD